MSKDEAEEDATPLLEWVFGALGLLLFLGALGVIIFSSMGPNEPPLISIQADAPEPASGRYRVEFDTLNEGDQTAELVRVVASLSQGDVVVETRQIEIDFLPPHSSRRAGVFFTHNPQGLTMSIEAVGYQEP